MILEPCLTEADPWMGLAAAVVLQALEDLSAPEADLSAEARAWLLGPGLTWCRFLGIAPRRVELLLCGPESKQVLNRF